MWPWVKLVLEIFIQDVLWRMWLFFYFFSKQLPHFLGYLNDIWHRGAFGVTKHQFGAPMHSLICFWRVIILDLRKMHFKFVLIYPFINLVLHLCSCVIAIKKNRKSNCLEQFAQRESMTAFNFDRRIRTTFTSNRCPKKNWRLRALPRESRTISRTYAEKQILPNLEKLRLVAHRIKDANSFVLFSEFLCSFVSSMII